jgi:modulator of FtsH protease HflC
MKKIGLSGLILLLIGAVIVISESAYTVYEYEQVLITQFGKIQYTVNSPGLKFKVPFVQNAIVFDKRWLEWSGNANEIPTRDKKYVWIDVYARWRIKNPVLFFKVLRDEPSAHSRLDDIIDGEVRNVIANHDLIDIVRTSSRPFEKSDDYETTGQSDEGSFVAAVGREKLTRLILSKASAVMPEYGIELADVQVKRVNYVESVQQKVFERMISERKRIAERFRSEGQGKAAEISGKVEREKLNIESEAYRKAQEVKGRADAEAARIYADAYNTNPNLYEFVKSMETYGAVIDKNTNLVLSTDSDLLKFLHKKD